MGLKLHKLVHANNFESVLLFFLWFGLLSISDLLSDSVSVCYFSDFFCNTYRGYPDTRKKINCCLRMHFSQRPFWLSLIVAKNFNEHDFLTLRKTEPNESSLTKDWLRRSKLKLAEMNLPPGKRTDFGSDFCT